jgi:hypothetical protein
LAVWPLLTVMVVEAKNRERSSIVTEGRGHSTHCFCQCVWAKASVTASRGRCVPGRGRPGPQGDLYITICEVPKLFLLPGCCVM